MLNPRSNSARLFRLVWEALREVHDAAYQPSYIVAGSYKALLESERLSHVPSLKSKLRQLERRGVLKISRDRVSITTKGICFGIIRCMSTRSEPLPDGVSCFVTFDIPDNSIRDLFRRLLRRLGFQRLHQSVWVSERNYADHLLYFVIANKLEKHIAVIEGEMITFTTGTTKVIRRLAGTSSKKQQKRHGVRGSKTR